MAGRHVGLLAAHGGHRAPVAFRGCRRGAARSRGLLGCRLVAVVFPHRPPDQFPHATLEQRPHGDRGGRRHRGGGDSTGADRHHGGGDVCRADYGGRGVAAFADARGRGRRVLAAESRFILAAVVARYSRLHFLACRKGNFSINQSINQSIDH